ncbi:hypothetical protein [Hyalangium gracile]|uniref:hypothetical protein n=1 Tax=Hyalangium gracile TaxID=394092 RepID=UPI001CCE5CD9|nr:hypothetical protein [Hyalangium gracile]
MRSLVSFLVLVLLAGCGSMKGCGGSASAPAATPASATSPSASGSKDSAASLEADFASKYLVIVHSSPMPGEGKDVIEKLGAAGLGSGVKRLSSTPFASLKPCLEVVVAGAFAEKEAAIALAGRLKQAGVKHYLKNAGALAQDRARREADCQRQLQAQAAVAARAGSPGEPRLMDLRGPQSFVLLSSEPKDTPGATLRQVGEDRGFWMATLREDPNGAFQKGATVDVYDRQGLLKSGCRVKGFASLNRGIPHFGYFQDAEPPKEPGCGGAWPVAELDCSLVETRAMQSDAIAFVLPGGAPAPRYFARSDSLPEPLRASQEAALRALPAFAKTRAEGESHAREQGLPLQESVEFRVFSAAGRQVVVGLAHFYTGEGNDVCGGPDFTATVSRVAVVVEGGQESLVAGEVKGESVQAVIDLEGDGRVELLTLDSGDSQGRTAIVREDGSPLAASYLANCDCGC